MLPVYVSYFAGGEARQNGENARISKPLGNATGFVLGFTIVFVALGAFAASLGRFFIDYSTVVNIVTGLVVIILGLRYLGILPYFSFRLTATTIRKKLEIVGATVKPSTFPSAFVFGVVFSIGWTPCISAFLGAAITRASQQGHMAEGMFMLFIFSMGLGLPFIASAVLIDRLKGAFDFIKKHYRVINCLSGGLLILVGILMITGFFGRYMALFAS